MNIELRTRQMTAAQFRAFQAGRPDHERWELLAGVPMMMTPPTLAHNRIASNLDRLLNNALEDHDPTRIATQRPGIELGSGDYKPEPDVGVIDVDYAAGQRFVDRVYLLAEIVSDTDEVRVPGTNAQWIDIKREIYREHAPCEVVMIIEQERMEVQLDEKTEKGWAARVLGAGDDLNLPGFGLSCSVADLYEGTPLHPRPARRPTV